MFDLLWATLGRWHQHCFLNRGTVYFGQGPSPMTGHYCRLGSGKKSRNAELIFLTFLWSDLSEQVLNKDVLLMERQMEGKKWQKEEEASDCTLWGTCFGRGYEPDVKETMKLMNEQILFKDTIVMRCQKETFTLLCSLLTKILITTYYSAPSLNVWVSSLA